MSSPARAAAVNHAVRQEFRFTTTSPIFERAILEWPRIRGPKEALLIGASDCRQSRPKLAIALPTIED